MIHIKDHCILYFMVSLMPQRYGPAALTQSRTTHCFTFRRNIVKTCRASDEDLDNIPGGGGGGLAVIVGLHDGQYPGQAVGDVVVDDRGESALSWSCGHDAQQEPAPRRVSAHQPAARVT
jgi:hypothetical protein